MANIMTRKDLEAMVRKLLGPDEMASIRAEALKAIGRNPQGDSGVGLDRAVLISLIDERIEAKIGGILARLESQLFVILAEALGGSGIDYQPPEPLAELPLSSSETHSR